MTTKPVLDEALYLMLRDALWNDIPQARAAIREAAANVPDPAPLADQLDAHIGLFVEKPLYAQMKAAKGGLGDRYSFMWRNGWFPTPQQLVGAGWHIDKSGRHDYVATGADIIAFQQAARRPLGDAFPGKTHPRVSLDRLYRMRKIATRWQAALPAIQAAHAGFRSARNADDFYRAMKPVLEAFDTSAMTTKFHAMTDLGFDCIKPDLHAARTMAWFGRLRTQRPVAGVDVNAQAFDAPTDYLKSQWNQCHVVSEGVALARSLDPSKLLPEFRGNACREVDIVLMQASLHDVILRHA